MSLEEIELCEKRRKARIEMLADTKSRSKRNSYNKLNKEVKKAVKHRKKQNLEDKIKELDV